MNGMAKINLLNFSHTQVTTNLNIFFFFLGKCLNFTNAYLSHMVPFAWNYIQTSTCMTLLIYSVLFFLFFLFICKNNNNNCNRHPQKQKYHLPLYNCVRARGTGHPLIFCFHCRACINWMHNLLFSFN